MYTSRLNEKGGEMHTGIKTFKNAVLDNLPIWSAYTPAKRKINGFGKEEIELRRFTMRIVPSSADNFNWNELSAQIMMLFKFVLSSFRAFVRQVCSQK